LGSSSQLITWAGPLTNLRAGSRIYELTNHLGNVLATVPDMVNAIDTTNDADADYNEAYIQSAQDYYPFGMIQPGRTLRPADTDSDLMGWRRMMRSKELGIV
jgi:hypothetical protein